jgi:hypothetical protein
MMPYWDFSHRVEFSHRVDDRRFASMTEHGGSCLVPVGFGRGRSETTRREDA